MLTSYLFVVISKTSPACLYSSLVYVGCLTLQRAAPIAGRTAAFPVIVPTWLSGQTKTQVAILYGAS